MLAIVATPIGNMGDITRRAEETLRQAHLIACEDTRVTGKLLQRLGIKTPMTPYHEHNAAQVRPKLIERMKCGETVALVSDAGTPLISDPGYKLVTACREENVTVTTLPGASALLAALTLAGLPTDRFLFAGFLPDKSAARTAVARELSATPATLVFYESPRRLAACLADLAAVLGPRPASVCRELTKLYEEVRSAPLDELAAHYAAAETPKGEVVLVIGPPQVEAPTEADLDGLLRQALRSLSLKEAAQAVAEATGLPKRQVYACALEIKDHG
ncbi:MAG: 16S rRNA (cytidine(1402)-2'-O)-methyltransferase [Alphaproteobacteria bacterium RIFOXYD12_FULL_60_8]|nr:MAG: 16S rRNA (cytidine(1402)-2'-O)-methyltransferase [Alphaproteobacteria bacterium RIFOXYD12_FULL_60_8]